MPIDYLYFVDGLRRGRVFLGGNGGADAGLDKNSILIGYNRCGLEFLLVVTVVILNFGDDEVEGLWVAWIFLPMTRHRPSTSVLLPRGFIVPDFD